MSVFGNYARYYNLLYRDKDYAAEAAFVRDRLGLTSGSLLDLGCGTGRHAVEMTRHGLTVAGVDMSQTMLDMGRPQMLQVQPSPVLHQGDARSVRLHQTFDAVVSLFHVMSYQTKEEDALAVLTTANLHLQPGGLFMFDFWYGPGVLTSPPTIRERILEDGESHIIRHARPDQRINDNIVDVHYDITIEDKKTGEKDTLHECHSMRYWFMPELRFLCLQAGFAVVMEGNWMSAQTAGKETWNAYMVAKKVK